MANPSPHHWGLSIFLKSLGYAEVSYAVIHSPELFPNPAKRLQAWKVYLSTKIWPKI